MHWQIRHCLKLKAEGRLQNCIILHGCLWLQAFRKWHIGLLLSLQQTYMVSLSVLRRCDVLHRFCLVFWDAHVIVTVKRPAVFDLLLRHRYLRSRFCLTLPNKFSILRMDESENFALIVVKVRLSLKIHDQGECQTLLSILQSKRKTLNAWRKVIRSVWVDYLKTWFKI